MNATDLDSPQQRDQILNLLFQNIAHLISKIYGDQCLFHFAEEKTKVSVIMLVIAVNFLSSSSRVPFYWDISLFKRKIHFSKEVLRHHIREIMLLMTMMMKSFVYAFLVCARS